MHGEANKATIFFEKSAMGFAWYIEAPTPVGVPEGQRSAIPTPHAHGTGVWARAALVWGGPPRTGRGGALERMGALIRPPDPAVGSGAPAGKGERAPGRAELASSNLGSQLE
jgi:hypothetical protein